MHQATRTDAAGVPGAGLCNSCLHQRVVVSSRGSAFSLCLRAATEPQLARYPPLPVRACTAMESRSG